MRSTRCSTASTSWSSRRRTARTSRSRWPGIERGLAVVVDKPLALTAADARRLLDAGGRLTVFQNRRWDGDFLTVKRLIGEGTLGASRASSRASSASARRSTPRAGASRPDAAEGGGLLLDLGAAPRRPGGAAVRPAGGGVRASSTSAPGRAGGRRRLRRARARGRRSLAPVDEHGRAAAGAALPRERAATPASPATDSIRRRTSWATGCAPATPEFGEAPSGRSSGARSAGARALRGLLRGRARVGGRGRARRRSTRPTACACSRSWRPRAAPRSSARCSPPPRSYPSSPHPGRRPLLPPGRDPADVAQLVEHFTRNEGVPGSSPGVGLS